MTWFQTEIDCFEDVRQWGHDQGFLCGLALPPLQPVEIASVVLTKGSSVGLLYLLFNQVEIASVVLTKAFSVDLL